MDNTECELDRELLFFKRINNKRIIGEPLASNTAIRDLIIESLLAFSFGIASFFIYYYGTVV